jgi:hypothetical protein
VAASAVTDPAWLSSQLAAAARRYRLTRPASVGVLWWYSASSVLLGPPVESFVRSFVRGGPCADPALGSMTLFLHPDGRVLDASSAGVVAAETVGKELAVALSSAVDAVAEASGARTPPLWAIATDSLANRVLWAGGTPEVAAGLAASIGTLPVPRYASVGGTLVVRRASCCLIYEAPGEQKCVSCPRQHPDERNRRLRVTFGQAGGTTR